MPKFLLAYHGGQMADDPAAREASMNEWMQWFSSLGGAVVDGGNPISRAWTVTKDGTTEGAGANAISGYSLLMAENMQKALELVQGCPVLKAGGSIELCETIVMG
jgi:hypothetical protein